MGRYSNKVWRVTFDDGGVHTVEEPTPLFAIVTAAVSQAKACRGMTKFWENHVVKLEFVEEREYDHFKGPSIRGS